MTEIWAMTVIKGEESWEIVEQDGAPSTKTDDPEVMRSGL